MLPVRKANGQVEMKFSQSVCDCFMVKYLTYLVVNRFLNQFNYGIDASFSFCSLLYSKFPQYLPLVSMKHGFSSTLSTKETQIGGERNHQEEE